MRNWEVGISVANDLQYLDLIQEVSNAISRTAGFDDDTRYWIGLSVRESVVNAVQHGNKLDASKRVDVRFEILSDRLVISVRDEGEGFDMSELPDPRDPENLLKPSGRGIFYVRSFMDDVRFQQLPEGGMEVRMEKKLAQGSPAE